MSGTLPAPTNTITVIAGGSYPAGTRTFASRLLPDAVTALQIVLDTSTRDTSVGVSATVQISYDGGATWMTYTAGVNPGDANIGNLAIAIGLSGGLPMVSGRLIQGSVSATGPITTPTGVTVNVWQ